MKILYHHRIASFDGQAIHIRALVEALRAAGHEVVVVGPPVLEALQAGHSFRLVARLKRLLPKALYELLEAAYTLPSFIHLLWVWFRFRPDVLYERYNLFQPAGAWLRRLVGLSFLLEVNAPLLQERAANDGLALTGLAARTERFVFASADRVLAVSRALAEIVAAAGATPERTDVIANGVSAPYLREPSAPEAAKAGLGLGERTVVGFVGFPRDWHRLARMVELIARHDLEPPLHLLIVGDGPALASLRERAEALGVGERVSAVGAVAHDRVVDYLNAFDVAVQPGVTPYASPLKIIEYMALGRAIVAPDTGNIRELLTDGESALLFDPDDLDGLDAAVLRLAGDAALRARVGQEARRQVLERRLTWQANAERVAAIAGALVEAAKPEHRP